VARRAAGGGPCAGAAGQRSVSSAVGAGVRGTGRWLGGRPSCWAAAGPWHPRRGCRRGSVPRGKRGRGFVLAYGRFLVPFVRQWWETVLAVSSLVCLSVQILVCIDPSAVPFTLACSFQKGELLILYPHRLLFQCRSLHACSECFMGFRPLREADVCSFPSCAGLWIAPFCVCRTY